MTTPKLYINVVADCDDWLAHCPDAELLSENAARRAFARGGGDTLTSSASSVVIGITLTDDGEQRALNRDYRGRDMSTNVLAFSTLRRLAVPTGVPVLLGDVVLAFETVAREAEDQEKPLADHLRHLVVHGVLHLLGFDHDGEGDAAAMEAAEVEILKNLGVPDPYRDTI